MRLTYLAYTFGLVMKYFSLVLFFPILIALKYGEYHATYPIIIAALTAMMMA